jgi:hypothetical protein
MVAHTNTRTRAKTLRVLILAALALLVLMASAFVYTYFERHRMTPVATWEAGAPTLPQRVLIATQGSAFKDSLVAELAARLGRQGMYVKVADVTALAVANERDWHAVVIVHTWEFGRAPRQVSDFVGRSTDPERIFAVTTSGSGRERLPGVDVVSSASVMVDAPALAGALAAKIGALAARE